MKILLVDDDRARSEKLRSFIAERLQLVDDAIECVDCLDAARRAMRSNFFDGLVLDVVIPKRSGDAAPSAANGFALLDELSRDSRLRRPACVIGLTAHLDDLSAFREAFEAQCHVVVAATSGSDQWRATICRGLEQARAAQLSRQVGVSGIVVMTMHGIRTYGSWQSKLERTIADHVTGVSFLNYKYGYFSAISLLIPWLRRREVKRLSNHLSRELTKCEGKLVYIFAHSFGTYLVAEALRLHMRGLDGSQQLVLVMAGSVLPSDFDWSFLDGRRVTLVNECGTRDHVLWLSSAFAIGLGMAGKTGFVGFDREGFTNRHFHGGHSLYFTDDQFMSKYWLPLIEGGPSVAQFDARGEANPAYMAVETIIRVVGRLKVLGYLVVCAAFGFWLMR